MMGELIRKSFNTIVKQVGQVNRILITTRSVDLAGDRVFSEGVDFEGYMKRRTVLWGHNALPFTAATGGIPIARTTEIVRERDGLVADFEFLDGDPFADRVRNGWEKGFINAASIGFVAKKSKPNEFGGFDIIESKLVEWSLVPVPMNPDALRRGLEYFELIDAETARALDTRGESGEGDPPSWRDVNKLVGSMERRVKKLARGEVRVTKEEKVKLRHVLKTVMEVRAEEAGDDHPLGERLLDIAAGLLAVAGLPEEEDPEENITRLASTLYARALPIAMQQAGRKLLAERWPPVRRILWDSGDPVSRHGDAFYAAQRAAAQLTGQVRQLLNPWASRAVNEIRDTEPAVFQLFLLKSMLEALAPPDAPGWLSSSAQFGPDGIQVSGYLKIWGRRDSRGVCYEKNSVDFDEYLRLGAPVFLEHSYEAPVGKVLRLEADARGLQATCQFFSRGPTETRAGVGVNIRTGRLRNLSGVYRPVEQKELRVSKAELIEISLVRDGAIGADGKLRVLRDP